VVCAVLWTPLDQRRCCSSGAPKHLVESGVKLIRPCKNIITSTLKIN
jgi:hypothetical protein